MTEPVWCPFAERKPVPSYSHNSDGTPFIIPPTLGLVLHVTTNWSDPYGYFDNPANQASSDWWVRKDGHLEQYVPSNYRAWAQANGNGTYNSVETDGTPDVPLTDAQVQAVARLYVWGHQTFGWPLQLAEAPGQRGFGWHGMGGAGWGGHYDCPGDIRRGQRQHILDVARNLLAPKPAPLPAWYHRLLTYPVPTNPGVTKNVRLSNGAVVPMQYGGDVWHVQQRVGSHADGYYGPNTVGAVRAFQHAHGLVVDGDTGANTARAIG